MRGVLGIFSAPFSVRSAGWLSVFGAVLATLLGLTATATFAASPDDAAFFTDRVLPILRERCFGCHSHEGEINGGLALDVRSGWEKGGASGPAIVPARRAGRE